MGPDQHMQIAQARALENGKPVVRATNNGYSALIAADGSILQLAERFVPLTLNGQIELRSGQTPFSAGGQWPSLLLALLLLFADTGRRRLAGSTLP